MNDNTERKAYIASMAPHQKDRQGGKLLLEADATIDRLTKERDAEKQHTQHRMELEAEIFAKEVEVIAERDSLRLQLAAAQAKIVECQEALHWLLNHRGETYTTCVTKVQEILNLTPAEALAAHMKPALDALKHAGDSLARANALEEGEIYWNKSHIPNFITTALAHYKLL